MRISKLIPKYSQIPLILLLGFNCVTYFGTRFFTQGMEHHNISTPLDNALPLVPEFILFYLLAYVQWIVGYIVIARESREVCYEIFTAELLAKLACLVCFLVFPTTLDRPEITGGGIFNYLTALIYSADAPDNLFPSIHCLESWVCFRGAVYAKKMPGWYKWVMLFFSLGVFASTVLVKQHVIYDMFGAVAFVELGLFVTRRFGLSRLFGIIENRTGV